MPLLKSSQMQSYGFEKADKEAELLAEKTLKNYVSNLAEKLTSKYKKVDKYNEEHVMKGGRVVLPIDYFGASSLNNVHSCNHTSMLPTATYIRPPLDQTFEPILTQGGGKKKFTVSQSKVSDAWESTKLAITSKGLKAVKEGYERKMNDALKKASVLGKHENVLSKQTLTEVLQMKKYAMLWH